MDKLNQALDLFTEGLRSDPEVRLDIRRELQSHLEEKIAEETIAGHSDEESLELALKTFGSPVEVADDLADANRQRMKFRARMRLLAGTLLIPAVIICAIFSLNVGSSFNFLGSIFSVGEASTLNKVGKIFSFNIFPRYTPEQQFILYGDHTKKTNAERQKAIWDKFPDNKIYAANYITSLMGSWSYDGKNRDFVLSEIGRAERLDPDNALYNYLAAGIMLKAACKEIALPQKDRKIQTQYRIEIKDRALLEKAMREYLIGVNKKYCSSYTKDLLKQRLQIIGRADSLGGQLEQISVAAGTILPNLSFYRSMSIIMPEYAGFLIKEGKKQEALQYLNTWQQFIRHINSDGDYLIGVLVTAAIARIDMEKLPPLYEKLGMAKTAKKVVKDAELLYAPVKEFKEKVRLFKFKPAVNYGGGALTNVLLPGLGREFTNEELAPERHVEYVFCQKITLAVINLLLLIGIIFATGTALYWRLRSGSRLLLLTPPPRTMLKIMSLSIILPGIIYFALTQIEPLSGYNFGITFNFPRFIAQMSLLLLFIPAIVMILTGRYVATRCRELGVEIPPPSGKFQKILAMVGLAVLVIMAFTPLFIKPPYFINSPAIFVLSAGGVILAGWIILRIAHLVSIIFSGKKYNVYYGAVARMVALTLALAVLVTTCIFRPILDWRETKFIQADKLIFGSAESFTRVENDVIRELKNKMDQALNKIQPTP
ncbi:MAG: permease prefix domain 1-containing protein [Victivallaceae bacterium]